MNGDQDKLGFGAFADLPFGARDERPGLLFLADDVDLSDAEMLSRAAGLRLLGAVPLDKASARLDTQIGCDIILCFCPDPSATVERLLVQVETLALQNEIPVILVASIDAVDMAFACLRSDRTQLLCQPGHTDLAAALLAAARQVPERLLHDASRDNEGLRLQQLSDEVSRLARTLEALTLRPRHAAPSFDLGPRISDEPSDYIGMPTLEPIGSAAKPAEPASVDATQVRDLLRARRLRDDFLPADLFADPAWDMLLDLFAARLEHERVSVSSLCIASAVPPTTALRWIRTLTEKGFVHRQADPHDGRRVFIALADQAAEALSRWFVASRRYLCG